MQNASAPGRAGGTCNLYRTGGLPFLRQRQHRIYMNAKLNGVCFPEPRAEPREHELALCRGRLLHIGDVEVNSPVD